jgi:S-layer protein
MAITAATRTDIIELVVLATGGAPGVTLLSDLVTQVESGKTLKDVATALTSTASWKATYPIFATPEEFASEFLDNIVPNVGADAKAEGVAVIVAMLNSGSTKADILVEAAAYLSNLSTSNAGFGSSAALFQNQVAVATYHTVTLELDSNMDTALSGVTSEAASVTSAKAAVDAAAAPPPAAGKTFALTTGIDSISGGSGDDTISSTTAASTLTALDSIDGGDGSDTISLTSAGAFTVLPTATVSNVENAVIVSGSTVTADVSDWSGLSSLTVASVGGGTLTAGNAVGVTATDTAGGGTIAVVGGKAVSVTVKGTTANENVTVDDAAGAVTITTATGGAITVGGTTKVDDTVTITDTKQGASAIAVDGGTNVSITNTTTSTGTVTVGATTKPTGTVTIAETLSGTGALAGGNIAVTGGTSVDVSIAASQATKGASTTVGSITVTGGTSTTSVTAAGTKVVTAAATVAAVTEKNTATFIAMKAGQSVTVGGLTFTAGSAGTTAAETAGAFASLADGATTGASTKGTYSGALSGWSTGVVSTADVVFTSATAGKNVTDLSQTSTGTTTAIVTFAKTEGVAAAGAGGIVANTITVNDSVTDNTSTTASTIASISASNYTTLTIDDNALSSLSLTQGSGNVSIDNTSARTTATTTLALTLNGVTGGTLDDADVYKTINVTTTGADSTLANITDTAVTALTVAGEKKLTLTSAAGMTALKTVTVSGSAGLSATLTGLAASGSIDASGTSGANTITLNSTVATYSGGSGVDTVTTSAGVSKAISLGAGNDVLTLAAGVTTLTAAVAGGDGTDTLVMVAADAATASADLGFVTKISDFEALKLTGGAGASVDVSTISAGATINVAAGAGVTLTKVAASPTLTISGAQTGTITVTGNDVTGTADSMSISLETTTGGIVDAVGYETINLAAAAAGSVTIKGDTKLTKLVITGSKAATVTLDAADTKLTSIDASASTGGITVTSVSTAAATITGGSGDDVLTAKAGTTAETLIGGAGNDTLTSNSGLTTLTGGAGYDIFVVGGAGANGNVYTTITDASAGDSVQLAANKGTETFAATALALGDTATFSDYLNLAASGDGSTNGAISWFQFGGNTYIVEDLSAGATFTAGTDVVVRLTGEVSIAKGSLWGADANILLIA